MLDLLTRWLKKFEDFVLVAILSLILLLAVGQILLRNLFDMGVVWFDPLSRILVLWLALVAVGIATREKQHLAIDLLNLFPQFKNIAEKLVSVSAGTLCLLIAWFSIELVQFEYEDGFIAFANVPTWLTQTIIPLSFTLMGVRFFLNLFASPNNEQ